MPDPTQIFSPAGRVACVLGGSSGIGYHAVKTLASAGAKVVAVSRREMDSSLWSAEVGDNSTYISGDLFDREALPDLFDKISAPYGNPDILINCAGMNPRTPVDEMTLDQWDKTIELNLSVPYLVSKHFIGSMIEKGWGRIVNFASLQSYRAFKNSMPYGASKGGIVQLTRAMAECWSAHGININAIGPGFFPTELTEKVFSDPELAKKNADQTCIGRNGTMDDLTGPLLFLCSEASAYVTGQVIMVDGGFTAK